MAATTRAWEFFGSLAKTAWASTPASLKAAACNLARAGLAAASCAGRAQAGGQSRATGEGE
ncbi:MAG: hypothetical protein JRF33_25685 [Deltaproteobacteria bacterium]|nr:hypothetical protein [Deltaproteobacteria bacterium]